MDISVNNNNKLYIYAEMLRSYPCTCIWVKPIKKAGMQCETHQKSQSTYVHNIE